MWKSIVIVGFVMNTFSSGAPIRDEPVRKMTIAGYWTLNPQLSDPTESESGVLNVNGVEGWVSSETGWPAPSSESGGRRMQEAVMIEIRRILCPVDFSDYSRRALDHAIAIARWYQSSVTALHVFSPALIAPYGPGPIVFEPIVLAPADRDQLLADTKAFIEAEAAPGVAIEAVLREGNTAAEILDQATKMSADLLVIGTHGRSGFERLLLWICYGEGAAQGALPGAHRAAAASRRRAFRTGSVQADPPARWTSPRAPCTR